MSNTENILVINQKLNGLRIDVALSLHLNKPRAQVQKALKDELVLVNGKHVKASYKVVENDEVTYTLKDVTITDLKPLHTTLDVIYEDAYLLIINKPAGLVVHPSFGHRHDTLVNALVARFHDLSDVGGTFRPGIVHRLDKETSGLLIVCKNNDVHNKIAKLLKNHQIVRCYTALVVGDLKEESGVIKTFLTRSKDNYQKMVASATTGKLAVTHFNVIERFPGYMLLKVELETGRTHQIRAHMEFIKTPVVGDNLYGKNNTKLYNKGQLLHAGELTFVHPYTHEKMTFTAPLPTYFENVLTKLRKGL